MYATRYIFLLVFIGILSSTATAQWGGGLRFPSLSEARLGHLKAFKIPALKDYQNFTKGYQKHLAILNRRSEKAYRKSFLKFIAVEDELLYTLCDSNEFRANALMRSAAASFGKMEADRNRSKSAHKPVGTLRIQKAVMTTLQRIPELKANGMQLAIKHREKNQHRYGAEQYATYMQNRVRLYKATFKDGTKFQKRLFRKLQRRALLWKAFKAQDRDLLSRFADKNLNILKSVEAASGYKSAMSSAIDYSGTQLAPTGMPNVYDPKALLEKVQQKLKADGILSTEQIENAKNITQLFKKVQEQKQAVLDSLNRLSDTAGELAKGKKKKQKQKSVEINSKSAQRFWDRIYGGVNFDWENSTGYYPDGLGINLTAGYHISDDSGLNIETQAILNGAKMGFSEDLRFESTLVSNYTIGMNIDYRLWKFLFAAVGSEIIINTIEAPALQTLEALEHTKYTLGVPLILKALIPISGLNSTTLSFSYDLNSQNNIKPKFDFTAGFLIGR